MAASFTNRIGTGIQFGGAVGLQESYVFGRGRNGIRFSAGYTGIALGYDRYLAWIIHENAQFSLAPFAHREFRSVGNTVCIPLLLEIPCEQRVLRDNRTFHE